MVTKMKEMPVLQAEDDGFLLQLKMSVLDKHLETLGLEGCDTLVPTVHLDETVFCLHK